MGINSWINLLYVQPDKIKHFQQQFHAANPFPHLVLPTFLQLEKAIELVQALADEKFEPKEADLFQFKQTSDLIGSKSKLIQEFRALLCSVEFISHLSSMTGCHLKPQLIDISGTLYEDTDFLLCHDDRLEGRKIAYTYYLSTLSRNEGGGLVLFESKNDTPAAPRKIITPTFNTLVLFPVTEKSFHAVEEVVRDVQRVAISGWFHD